jgi:saccharopine dehydrogenase-like NADP-dependent oxidoreductase
MPLRTLILGGTGNFGARIVRALAQDPNIELIAASRRPRPIDGAAPIPTVRLDIHQDDFVAVLRALSPQLLVHTVGPFQEQDYRVVRAALAVGAHYIDLADGRRFVSDFAAHNDALARSAGLSAICGASTLPALSGAVVEALHRGMDSLDSVDIAIAPGQRAARGAATVAGVLGYLGKPVMVWRGGRWCRRYGWMDLARVPLRIGDRLGALCDVPDLELLPRQYPDVSSVTFRAALEFRLQHYALFGLGLMRRIGVPVSIDRWSARLDAMAPWFDRFAADRGAMRVSIAGSQGGRRIRRTWELQVPARDGPEIPCLAALLLTRRLARGEALSAGANTALGLLSLEDFQHSFARLGVSTDITETLS